MLSSTHWMVRGNGGISSSHSDFLDNLVDLGDVEMCRASYTSEKRCDSEWNE